MEFVLSGKVTISVYTKVDANTLKEAIEEAGMREIESYQWGQPEREYESWLSSEYDGEIFDIEHSE